MKIAVTFENGNVFQHFGHTEKFKIYDISNGKIINESIVDTNGSGHGALAGFLKENSVDTLTINKDNMRNAARKGFMNATDAADWLVKQGVPFRDAHAIIGQLVLYSINNNKNLDDLTLDEYKAVSDVFTEDIYKAIDLDTCVNTRTVPGGPSEAYIKSLIELNKKCIENLK